MSDDMGEFREEPSRYIWKWTTWSTVCVVLGLAVALMFWTLGDHVGLGIALGVLVAVAGGVGFGFVPRASLHQRPQAMTPKAQRKAATERARRREADEG